MPRKQNSAARQVNDTGPRLLAQHAAVVVEELPVFGRRARRQPMHERLWRDGTIDEAAYGVVEDFVESYELIARYGVGSTLGRLDATRGNADAHLAMFGIAADVAAMERAKKRLGAMRWLLIVIACVEGRSVSQMAKDFYGKASGGGRAQVEEAVLAAILLLAGQTP